MKIASDFADRLDLGNTIVLTPALPIARPATRAIIGVFIVALIHGLPRLLTSSNGSAFRAIANQPLSAARIDLAMGGSGLLGLSETRAVVRGPRAAKLPGPLVTFSALAERGEAAKRTSVSRSLSALSLTASRRRA